MAQCTPKSFDLTGKVALILDVPGLVHRVTSAEGRKNRALSASQRELLT